jgi:hypothetical protein
MKHRGRFGMVLALSTIGAGESCQETRHRRVGDDAGLAALSSPPWRVVSASASRFYHQAKLIDDVLTRPRQDDEVAGLQTLAELEQEPSHALLGGLRQEQDLFLALLGLLARDVHELLRHVAPAAGQLRDHVATGYDDLGVADRESGGGLVVVTFEAKIV